MRKLAEPTVLANGKRVPGLKLDHTRQLALMHALLRFSHIAAADTFTTTELHSEMAEALGHPSEKYSLGSVRYEMSKLRGKGLIEKLPHSRRYRLLPDGYRICLVFLKLFEKIYAPLSAGLLHPYRKDRLLAADCRRSARQALSGGRNGAEQPRRRCRIEGRCMICANENKVLVGAPITVLRFFADELRKSGPFGAVEIESGALVL